MTQEILSILTEIKSDLAAMIADKTVNHTAAARVLVDIARGYAGGPESCSLMDDILDLYVQI